MKRAHTSVGFEVSVDAIKRYKKEEADNAFAKVALEEAIPHYILRKCYQIAQEIKFLESIQTAIGAPWMEIMENIKREVNR